MSYLEDAFALWLKQPTNADLPEPVREHRFHPDRKWRFDFAWPDHRVAVEIEGITWAKARHQTFKGFLGDCEKYEAALEHGWTVYRIPGPWIADGDRYIWRPRTMIVLRQLLAAPHPRHG